MGKRILVAVVCIPLIFVILYVLPPIFLPIAVAALSAIGVHEALWSTGFVKQDVYKRQEIDCGRDDH